MLAKIGLFFILFNSTVAFSQSRTSLECIDREFNVIVHIVKDRYKFPIETLTEVNKAIDSVNVAWKPICMKFNICDIRYVDNFNFLQWHQDTMELEFLAIHHEPRTINVILVEQIVMPFGFAGYATLGGISMRGQPYIVINAGTGHVTWIHELGHYFGLLHTFEPPIGLADNSDCAINGDKICDTPADPYGFYNNTTCEYTGNIKDANGLYYNPLVENYMSYYVDCAKSFTHQQYLKMISTYKIDPQAHF